MNKVELLGRVTQNIELNYKNDKAYSKFFIAINSNKKRYNIYSLCCLWKNSRKYFKVCRKRE